MTREEAKDLFREDKDSYGKVKGVMTKLNKIFDEFEEEIKKLKEYKYMYEDLCK